MFVYKFHVTTRFTHSDWLRAKMLTKALIGRERNSPLLYQVHFKQVLTGFQVDPSCLTIDMVKPQLCPNSAPFCHPVRLSTIRPRSSSIQAI